MLRLAMSALMNTILIILVANMFLFRYLLNIFRNRVVSGWFAYSHDLLTIQLLYLQGQKEDHCVWAELNVILPGCPFWNKLLAVVCHAMCVQQGPCVLQISFQPNTSAGDFTLEFSSVVQGILISVEVFGWNDNLHARPLMPQSGLRSSGVEQ